MIKTRRCGVYGVVVLTLLVALGLTAAPAASAAASFITVTGTGTWADAPDPGVTWVSGGVLHMEMRNHFRSSFADPIFNGDSYTHVFVVAKLVDGQPTAGILYGTVRLEGAGSVAVGTATGTMDIANGTWSVKGRAKGISRAMAGWLIFFSEENPGALSWPLTVTYLAPHGM